MSSRPELKSKHTVLEIGPRSRFGENVVLGPNCKKVTIGAGCFIGRDTYIDVEELSIGDYFTLHHGSVIHGKKCTIGHNNWIGHYSILDALGGLLQIGNNVGIGAHSQLWSHMKFGDLMAGCRWHRNHSLIIEDDVWFVGHCIVTPIHAKRRSMLMVGGVAVRNMEENHVYAGSPTKDVTDKMGGQFEDVPIAKKEAMFAGYLSEFSADGGDPSNIQLTRDFSEFDPDVTWFNLETREYTPRYSDDEAAFMKFLLYERAKFVPRANT